MEQPIDNTKLIKRLVKKPISEKKSNKTSLFQIMNVIMFIMVFVIFVRGFNVKKTVREESKTTQTTVVKNLTEYFEIKRQIDINQILSTFALYSRLSKDELKEKEDYHKKMQEQYEKMATEYNQGLSSLSLELQEFKDTIK